MKNKFLISLSLLFALFVLYYNSKSIGKLKTFQFNGSQKWCERRDIGNIESWDIKPLYVSEHQNSSVLFNIFFVI